MSGDDIGKQARPVNLLETWGLVSRRGQRGNPLANGQHSPMGSQAHGGQDRRFPPNSRVRVLSRDRCIPSGYRGSLTTGSPVGPLSPLRVGSMYSLATVRTSCGCVRAVLRWERDH